MDENQIMEKGQTEKDLWSFEEFGHKSWKFYHLLKKTLNDGCMLLEGYIFSFGDLNFHDNSMISQSFRDLGILYVLTNIT